MFASPRAKARGRSFLIRRFFMIGDCLFGTVVTADSDLFAANRELYSAVGNLPIADRTF